MCGIAGILALQPERSGPPKREHARRMTDALVHRGPDEGDVHLEPLVALGHRRLSIIDVASGQQPMFNEDDTVGVVFNGEIYNFQEVADELVRAGHVFRTRSDTEVIVHGWEQWGEACVRRFRGMFAFAVWDRPRGTLFLARDRLGVKPLHYALLPDGQLLFGSELKAITAHPAFVKRLDPAAVEEYLAFGYVPDPRCIWDGARKLPAAHRLTLRVGMKALPEPVRYWAPEYTDKFRGSQEEALDELEHLLTESVKLRLMSEVPLGAFLSGGVDSSLVVARMATLQPGTRVKTCSIGFAEPDFDETAYARMVAERWNTDHVTRQVSVDDLSLLPALPALYDEPFGDSSALATYRVSELARQRVTVALSGDGGDEGFGGYRRYRLHVAEDAVRRRLPAPLRRHVFGPAARLWPEGGRLPRWLRARTTLESLSRSSLQSYYRAMCALPDALRAPLLAPALRRDLQGHHASAVFEQAARGFQGDDALDLAQHIDLSTWLSGDINTKVDRASMAHSLEVRDPLLDHVLIEWAARLPQSFRTTAREGKVLLKRAAAKVVPHEAIHRPKQGFGIPVGAWFRGPLGERLAQALRHEAVAGVVDAASAQALLDAHRDGRAHHDRPLWTLMCLAEFLVREAGEPLPKEPLAAVSAA